MEESGRIIDPAALSDDVAVDRAIRPCTLEEYVGQPAVREQMEIFIPQPGSATRRWITY